MPIFQVARELDFSLHDFELTLGSPRSLLVCLASVARSRML
jgi:hypothetical protein